MQICKSCGKEKAFNQFSRSKSYKSGYESSCKVCRQEARKRHVKNCQQCGDVFRSAKIQAMYCSKRCSGLSARRRSEVSCSFCGELKEIPQYEVGIYERHYCSRQCQAGDYRSRFSGENNPSYKSVEYSCDGCEDIFKVPPWRLRRSENVFCSRNCYESNRDGELNPYWNPELTEEDRLHSRNYPEYVSWRKEVFTRDLYTCQKCGDSRGGNLEAHHILNYSEHEELRLVVDNGTTLCSCCHKEFHGIYGYTNNDEQQIKAFLSSEHYKREEALNV